MNTQEGTVLIFFTKFSLILLNPEQSVCLFFNILISLPGAVLFELHAFDIVNELSNILSDLNSKKTPIWMQMRFVEVLASMLAEKIMMHGTKIFVSPDEIKWPDGTVTKPYESKGLKGRRKKKNPNSKDGSLQ